MLDFYILRNIDKEKCNAMFIVCTIAKDMCFMFLLEFAACGVSLRQRKEKMP